MLRGMDQMNQMKRKIQATSCMGRLSGNGTRIETKSIMPRIKRLIMGLPPFVKNQRLIREGGVLQERDDHPHENYLHFVINGLDFRFRMHYNIHGVRFATVSLFFNVP